MTDDVPALSTRDLTIRFGGQIAVNAVTCAFHRGTLTAIVGPNGAGKTTFFNLISGQLRPTYGSVSLFGKDITRMGAPHRTRLGLGRAFQLINLYPSLTCSRMCGSRCNRSRKSASIFSASLRATQRCVRKPSTGSTGSSSGPRANLIAAALSHGDQRKLEVAILLALEPQVLMFDEPTAGMSLDEIPTILDLIEEIKQETHKTVLLVEHRMDVVTRLADRIIVLQDGMLIADGAPADVVALPVVQQAYLGVQQDTAARGEALQ